MIEVVLVLGSYCPHALKTHSPEPNYTRQVTYFQEARAAMHTAGVHLYCRPYVTVAIKTLSSEMLQHSTSSILDGLLETVMTQLVPTNFWPNTYQPNVRSTHIE